MSNWGQQKKWQGAKSWGKGHKPNTAPKDKVQLPSYDGASWPSSSASVSKATADKEKDTDLKSALKEFLEQNASALEVPTALKEYIQPAVGQSLKDDQKLLNHKRKLAQKVERLKGAQKKKEEMWTQFRQQMKEHLAAEKVRFEKECLELAEALKTAQQDLDKAMSGSMETTEIVPEETDIELDEMLEDKNTRKDTDKEPHKEKAMEEALLQAQAGQMLLAEQVTALQQQMSYMAQLMKTPAVESPSRTVLEVIGVTPTTPPKEGESGKRKHALEPFSRRSAPYNTPEKEPIQASKTPMQLESLDGYGPT